MQAKTANTMSLLCDFCGGMRQNGECQVIHREAQVNVVCSGGTWTKNLGVPNYIILYIYIYIYIYIYYFKKKALHFISSFILLKTSTHNSRIQKNMTIIRYYIMIPNHDTILDKPFIPHQFDLVSIVKFLDRVLMNF